MSNPQSTGAVARAHKFDPDASHLAAGNLNGSVVAQVKEAVLTILAEEPRAAFQVRGVYAARRKDNGWPFLPDLYSVHKRMSDLHNEGRIQPVMVDGEQSRIESPNGATATVWEITPVASDPMPTILSILGMSS